MGGTNAQRHRKKRNASTKSDSAKKNVSRKNTTAKHILHPKASNSCPPEATVTGEKRAVPNTFSSNWEKLKPTISDRRDGNSHPAKMRKLNSSSNVEPKCGPAPKPLIMEKGSSGETRVVAIDCEMVGVGYEGHDSCLARVSIVNYFGHVLYDEYVKPLEEVVDYRTDISGIRPENVANAKIFFVVQAEVSKILKGKILIGHSIRNDLECLFLDHPKKHIRDTSKYKPFKKMNGGKTPKLQTLAKKYLNVDIQGAEHSSVEDAQATMRLYVLHRADWEKQIIETHPHPKSRQRAVAQDFVSDMIDPDYVWNFYVST